MKMRDVRRYETQVKEDCYQAYDRDYDGDKIMMVTQCVYKSNARGESG